MYPSCVHSLAGSFGFLPLGFPVSFPSLLPFSPSVGFSVCAQLLSILIPASSFLAFVRSTLSFSRLAMPTMWLVASYRLAGSLLAPSGALESFLLFSFLYGFLWPSRSPAGPCLPFTYAIWVLCPLESSSSACVSPLWLFLFSHRVAVLWFLLSLQALVSQSTFVCMTRVCPLSCPSTFLG